MERGDKENALNEILCVSLSKFFAVLRGSIFFTADLRKEAAKSRGVTKKFLGTKSDSHIISLHN